MVPRKPVVLSIYELQVQTGNACMWQRSRERWIFGSTNLLWSPPTRGNGGSGKGESLSKATQCVEAGLGAGHDCLDSPCSFIRFPRTPSWPQEVHLEIGYHDQVLRRCLEDEFSKAQEAGQKTILPTWWITWTNLRASFSKTKIGRLLDLEQLKLRWITR